MLHGEERRDLVVDEDDLPLRVQDEPHVEKPVLQVGMARLGLGYDVRIVLPRDLAQRFRLFPRDVDGAFPRELNVVHVEHFIVEPLERALGIGDETHGDIQAGQPRGRLHQMQKVFDVVHDVSALANAAHRRNQPDAGVWLDHALSPSF